MPTDADPTAAEPDDADPTAAEPDATEQDSATPGVGPLGAATAVPAGPADLTGPAHPVRRPRTPPNPRVAARLIVAARVVLLAAALVTVMLTALLIAMFVDDDRIDANPATATATVLSVTPLRTGIEFVDATGVTVRPPGGVLYPGLLSVGQEFVVEYSTVDPTIVRVAGRTASVGIVMIAGAAAICWVVAGPAVWWLRRRSGLRLFTRAAPMTRARHPVQAL